MRLLKECPSIFLFSIHTNMIFVTTENKPGMQSTASALQLGRQEPEKTTDEKSLPYKEGNLDKDQGWPIQSELKCNTIQQWSNCIELVGRLNCSIPNCNVIVMD
jgi:hypothetical protein